MLYVQFISSEFSPKAKSALNVSPSKIKSRDACFRITHVGLSRLYFRVYAIYKSIKLSTPSQEGSFFVVVCLLSTLGCRLGMRLFWCIFSLIPKKIKK